MGIYCTSYGTPTVATVAITVASVYDVALTTAIEIGTSPTKVIIRKGDELWQEEHIGISDKEIVWVNRFYIEDPLRRNLKILPYKWIIHEQREIIS